MRPPAPQHFHRPPVRLPQAFPVPAHIPPTLRFSIGITPMNNQPLSRRSPAAIELLEPRTLLAATLVDDIHETPVDLLATGHITVKDTLYFTANSTNGTELWKTDGTKKGTTLVKDINPGVASSDPNHFTRAGRFAYFSAYHDKKGVGLWRTDGTRAGTTLVKAIPEGTIQSTIAANGKVFFSVETGGYDFRDARDSVWVSDGTPKGTRPILRAAKGGNLEVTEGFVVYRGNVLFAAEANRDNQDLYATDGTAAGTRPLTNIPIDNIYTPNDLKVVNGHLLYAEPGSGADLWRTDLTNTFPVKDFEPDDFLSLLEQPVVAGDRLFFYVSYHQEFGEDPWISDGTPEGTYLLKDIVPGTLGSGPYGYTHLNGTTYFVADVNEDHQLWKTDGTPNGTLYTNHDARTLTALNNVLLVATDDEDDHNAQLASFDPAANTLTPPTSPPNSFRTGLGVVNGRYVFVADSKKGPAIWSTDGTPTGTRRIRSIERPTDGAYPSGMASDGTNLYFGTTNHANDPWDGPPSMGAGSLWKLRAADGQPRKIADLDGYVERIIPADGFTYFTVRQTYSPGIATPVDFYYLWRTDGTARGTHRVLPDVIWTRLASSYPPIVLLGDQLLFPYNGQLWTTDGTEAGSRMLIDTDVSELFPFGDDAVIMRDNADRLWLTDTTAANTRVIVDSQNDHDLGISEITVDDDRLYYTMSDHADDAVELWTTDATAEGARLLKRFQLPQYHDHLYGLTTANGIVYFQGYDSATGFELWKADGTANGTVLVKDIRKGPEGSFPYVLLAANGTTYLLADDGRHGTELWRTDGTAKNTKLVADINPGPASSAIQNATAIGNNLLFSADDGAHGREPWILRPNGTPTLLADIFPGRGSSDPNGFAVHNDALFFAANDFLHGKELWSAPL